MAAGLDVGKRGCETVRHLDRAHRLGLARVLRALLAGRPRRADAADEVDAGIEVFRQLGRNLPRPDPKCVLVHGLPRGAHRRPTTAGPEDRAGLRPVAAAHWRVLPTDLPGTILPYKDIFIWLAAVCGPANFRPCRRPLGNVPRWRSEEHTSELQSRFGNS